jgi:hypothetical protein
MPRSFEEHRFRKTGDHEYVCVTWFERERQNVRLETPRGRVIFDLWDDAVESGHLTVPRVPRPTDADWRPHALASARNTGLL